MSDVTFHAITMIDSDGSAMTISVDGELCLGDVIAPEAKVWIGPLHLQRGILGPLEVGRATKLKHVPAVVSITGVMFPSHVPPPEPDHECDSECETELAVPPKKLGKGYAMAPEPKTLQQVYQHLDLHIDRKRTRAPRDFFKPDAPKKSKKEFSGKF